MVTARAYLPPLRRASRRKRAENSWNLRSYSAVLCGEHSTVRCAPVSASSRIISPAADGMLLLGAVHLQQHKIVAGRTQHFDGALAALLIEEIGNQDHDSARGKIAHELLHRAE